MKIYTKTGDDGTTGLFGGGRHRKDAARIEAYGTVDELNCAIGVARAHLDAGLLDAPLARIQAELFSLGAELATDPSATIRPGESVTPAQTAALERQIDAWEEGLPPLKNFILPGGSPAAAALHLARTICRRAERRVLTLGRDELVADEAVRYLNRLSDYLFVAARLANRLAGHKDVPWLP